MSPQGGQNGGSEDDQVLVAEYALGLLEGAERDALSRRIAVEPALASDLKLWQARLATMDDQFAEAPAPTGALQRIERRLFGQPGSPTGNLWNSLTFWRSLTAAAAALAVIALGLNLFSPRLDAEAVATRLVAALNEQGTNVSFIALYDPASGSVRLTALSGDAVPDRDYELWAIQGSNAPVSMGVVPINQRSDIKLPALPQSFAAGTVLAITLEQKGGSPTGAPQGPIVAKGAATEI